MLPPAPDCRELSESRNTAGCHLSTAAGPTPGPVAVEPEALLERLRTWFGLEFTLVDTDTAELLGPPSEQPRGNDTWSLVARAAGSAGEPAIIAEEDAWAVLAVPVVLGAEPQSRRLVAVAPFATRHPGGDESLAPIAAQTGWDPARLADWFANQASLSVEAVLRLARGWVAQARLERDLGSLRGEIDQVSGHIAAAYEEISLLHRLTHNLRISSREEELAQLALDWLAEVVPAEGLAVEFLADEVPEGRSPAGWRPALWLPWGACPLDAAAFRDWMRRLALDHRGRPLVVNAGSGLNDEAATAGVRQAIVVPLTDGGRLFGWLAAFNSRHGREFGTHEAQLLSSVATLLGVHSGNLELYRQQQELLTGVIRALTSAIDAKDPYTCGHSDRVARVAVRLAEELGISGPLLQTVYLTGLLHDIGKIGIDDNVLRKPGKLTPAEFEHIKTHAELGHSILIDLKALGAVLPGVRHHHEAWDGTGYPHGLESERIPLLARIIAVADSFDAMGSDRPYRKGMDPAKLDEILRAGAGKQWDPEIIASFFRIRHEVDEIARHADAGFDPEVPQWVEFQSYRPVRNGPVEFPTSTPPSRVAAVTA